MRNLFIPLVFIAASPAFAADYPAMTKRAVEAHIIPGYEALAREAAALEAAAPACEREKTIAAWHAVFDAWMGVSHLFIGPAEANGRALSIAFWPDDKGFTPRALRKFISAENPVVDDPAKFADASIAVKGLFALEFLLYDEELSALGSDEYRCRFESAIARDLSRVSAEILAKWRGDEAPLMESAGAAENPVYLNEEEPAQLFYKAFISGLKTNIEQRLDRPLGSFDRPRPRLAEAWRSGRSKRNAVLSLMALEDLYRTAFEGEIDPLTQASVNASFEYALDVMSETPDPLDQAVSEPGTRFRVEAARSGVYALYEHSEASLGAALGLAAGFNAGDGD